jgi:hypothetical protein
MKKYQTMLIVEEIHLVIIKTSISRDLDLTTKSPKDKKHKLGCCENHAHIGKWVVSVLG